MTAFSSSTTPNRSAGGARRILQDAGVHTVTDAPDIRIG